MRNIKDVESKNCKILQEQSVQIRNLVGLYLHKRFLDSQLNEVKRKIALVEGKRRALQSSFERENKKNRAALTRLGEEVQVLVKRNGDVSFLFCFKQGWMYVTPRNNKYLGFGVLCYYLPANFDVCFVQLLLCKIGPKTAEKEHFLHILSQHHLCILKWCPKPP